VVFLCGMRRLTRAVQKTRRGYQGTHLHALSAAFKVFSDGIDGIGAHGQLQQRFETAMPLSQLQWPVSRHYSIVPEGAFKG